MDNQVHGSDGGLFPLQMDMHGQSLPLFDNEREREREPMGGEAKIYVNNRPAMKEN
jgi:hypothetical protein